MSCDELSCLPTKDAARALGRSTIYLKRLRDTHGGFLEAGKHYFLAPSRNAPITWDVPKIRAELHRRARMMTRQEKD